MKLSLRGEYALRAMVALAENYSDEVVPIHAISSQQDIPKRFLEQILNDLKAGGFVESKRGIAGGYRLSRPPRQILLAPVVQYIEGALVAESEDSGRNARLRPAAEGVQQAIHGMMREISKAIVQTLDKVTLADLSEQARRFRSNSAGTSDYTI